MQINKTKEEKVKRLNKIQKCSLCGRVINMSSFSDSKAIEEYHINGRCQKCQDNPFGKQRRK